MYEADRLTAAAGLSGLALMENAGQGVARAICQYYPPRKTLILCGPGQNGGDGYVVARALEQSGWSVTVAALGSARTGLDAEVMAQKWTGSRVAFSPDALKEVELVVDAIFGAGLTRPLTGDVLEMVRAVNAAQIPVVAIDLPTGIHGDSGAALGDAVTATRTVTFFRKKPGHVLYPGRAACGVTDVIAIGVPERLLGDIQPRQFVNMPALWRAAWPRAGATQHKYDRGHVLVASGGETTSGAARLAARAALRAGAGLVTLAVRPEAAAVVAAQSTAVMIAPYGNYSDLLQDPRRNVLLLGPGNGVGPATRANVLAALTSRRATVLDADALTVFADNAKDLFAAIAGPVILTPHEGEFRRLFSRSDDKLASVRRAAAVSGSIVLLKGADTVIAAPDGRAAINTNAPGSLATAGSGDVLSGIIAGLLAQGVTPFEAAAAGAWLHGAAASKFGPGLIAEDVPEMLPAVIADIAPGR